MTHISLKALPISRVAKVQSPVLVPFCQTAQLNKRLYIFFTFFSVSFEFGVMIRQHTFNSYLSVSERHPMFAFVHTLAMVFL